MRARRRGRAYHPLLNPTNAWTWRFLPGLLAGYVLSLWLNHGNSAPKKRPAPKEDAPQLPPGPAPPPQEEMKMVFVVNDQLKMGKGKIAAQCGHATYGLVKKLQQEHQLILRQWEACGQPKIALKGDGGEPQMKELGRLAAESNIPMYAVHDAGRTQIAAGSHTVLALGPAGRPTLIRDLT